MQQSPQLPHFPQHQEVCIKASTFVQIVVRMLCKQIWNKPSLMQCYWDSINELVDQ